MPSGVNIKEILVVLFLIIAIAVCAAIFNLKTTAVSNRINTEGRLFSENVAKKKVSEQLSRAQKDKEGLQKSVDNTMQEAATLEAELAAHKRDIDSVKQKIGSADKEAVSTKEKTELLNSNVTELKNRIANVVKDTLKLTEELLLLQKATEALKEHLKQYKDNMPQGISAPNSNMGPAGPIGNISEQQTGAASGPVLVGEILTINREFDFVVISLGKVDGIKEGMALQVYRDENRLGQIEIETVRDNISAAAITDKENLSRMRPGDKVSMPLGA